MRRRGYAKRKYLTSCRSDEFLSKDKVEGIVSKIVRLLKGSRGRVHTLNRLLVEFGFRYYSPQAFHFLRESLKKKGVVVKKVSNKRYIVVLEE
ncbi:MAG: hypothetical protein DRN91_06515 [Candidatus Alkanophagales archaeon]|nr:MAG: hypothetical protein DRN91_06515 [Candidatus Alkanophagales archaeon]